MSDLGTTVKSNLTWNSHVIRTVAKANQMLGFIKRSIGYKSNTDIRKTLYLSLVRSVLEYCSSVWSPTSRNLTALIEGVQRRATKYILGPSAEHLDYKSRLSRLGLLPLSHQREMSDVVVFVKSLAKVYDSDLARLAAFPTRTPRSSRAHMLVPQRVRSSSFASSFTPRLITIWNKLPVEIRGLGASATSPSDVSAFKRKLSTFMQNRFRQNFKLEQACTWSLACCCASCIATRPR